MEEAVSSVNSNNEEEGLLDFYYKYLFWIKFIKDGYENIMLLIPFFILQMKRLNKCHYRI